MEDIIPLNKPGDKSTYGIIDKERNTLCMVYPGYKMICHWQKEK